MAIQVSEALTQFGYYKQDIADVETDVFVSWCQFIERDVYRKLLKLFPNKFVSSQSYSVVDGAQSLPADFDNIRSLGTGFYLFKDNQLHVSRLALTSPGSRQKGFYFEGNQVVFTGFQNAETYMLRYIPKLVVVQSESDYFTIDALSTGEEIIPEQFMEFLVKALDVKYTQWDAMPGDESFADQRYANLLNEFLENYLPTAQLFPFEDDFAIYSYNGGFYNSYPGYYV
jgi:hypothetical protein